MTQFKFYNKGIAKQDASWNIQLFAEKFQEGGKIDGYFEVESGQLAEIFALLRKCIMENHFYAFSGEQMALANHIVECLNSDLVEYLSTIKKAALSSDDSDWQKIVEVMTAAYNDRFA